MTFEQIEAALLGWIEEAAGMAPGELAPGVNLLEAGVDSLSLIQVRDRIASQWSVEINIERFYMDLDSVTALSRFVHEAKPAAPSQPHAQPPPAVATPPVKAVLAERADEDTLSRICRMQWESFHDLTVRQMELLGGNAPAKMPVLAVPAQPKPEKPQENQQRAHIRDFRLEEDDFTSSQRDFVDGLIAESNERFRGSKEWAAKNREHLADWIMSLGFRKSLKELHYPVVMKRALGPRFWDVDGNEFIDLAMGRGVTFFGNNPPFILEAIERQMRLGMELGPQYEQMGEVASRLCSAVGAERATFTNTGSESVMVAMRLARAATGRRKIVTFTGDYHGTFDGVLGISQGGATIPVAPGTLPGFVEDLIVLPYGKEKSLDAIRALGDSLAAVLVEPVQSRFPNLRPIEFVKEVRSTTEKCGAALIFDEVLTGFRNHPRGAKHFYGVEPDIATYGKIVGGGMPMGAVAGRAGLIDWIDGGRWRFGDESHPGGNVTAFGGTFCKHPLSMAASLAALKHMEEEGPALQERVNEKMDALAQGLNAFFTEEGFPFSIAHFGSVFRFESLGRYALALSPVELDLFFRSLLLKGVYTWERRICFLSTTHGEAELALVDGAVRETLLSMRGAGFFPKDDRA